MDGWGVLAALKADTETAAIPVLVATVLDDRAKGIARGASEYLVKPVNRESLLAALSRVGAMPSSLASTASAREVGRR